LKLFNFILKRNISFHCKEFKNVLIFRFFGKQFPRNEWKTGRIRGLFGWIIQIFESVDFIIDGHSIQKSQWPESTETSSAILKAPVFRQIRKNSLGNRFCQKLFPLKQFFMQYFNVWQKDFP
jgi:hypothetical protein